MSWYASSQDRDRVSISAIMLYCIFIDSTPQIYILLIGQNCFAAIGCSYIFAVFRSNGKHKKIMKKVWLLKQLHETWTLFNIFFNIVWLYNYIFLFNYFTNVKHCLTGSFEHNETSKHLNYPQGLSPHVKFPEGSSPAHHVFFPKQNTNTIPEMKQLQSN